MRAVAKHPRTPRWLKWVGGVALLPIPGPVDELVLLLVLATLLLFRRDAVRESWRDSA